MPHSNSLPGYISKSNLSVQCWQGWLQVPVWMYQKSPERSCFHKLLLNIKHNFQDSLISQVFALSWVAEIFQKLGNFKTYSTWDPNQGATEPSSAKLNSHAHKYPYVHFAKEYISVFIIYVKLSYEIPPSRNGNICFN